MKFAIGAVIVCLYLAGAQGQDVSEKSGYYYQQRERLGHFKETPFTDLYKAYAVNFVRPLHKERQDDDFRNYLPSGDECINFLKAFRIDEYELKNIEEMVMLDACLGYLYESKHHDEDKAASQLLAENLDDMVADDKLRSLYESTQIDNYPSEAKDCIADLLIDAVRLRGQYKTVLWNNHWLQAFINFGECHKAIPEAESYDSYRTMIYSLAKNNGKAAYDNEIHLTNLAVNTEYNKDVFYKWSNSLVSFMKPLKKQAKERIYSEPLMNLLSAVQGTTQQVNLRQVQGLVKGVGEREPGHMHRFLNNIREYVQAKVNPKRDEATKQDPRGLARYQKTIDKLCNFFRTADNDNFYDYTTPFVRMIKLLEFPEVYGIEEQYFVDNVLKFSYQTAPVYLAVSSCNILTFTEGAFEQTAAVAPLKYKVSFRRDLSGMLRWPDAGFF